MSYNDRDGRRLSSYSPPSPPLSPPSPPQLAGLSTSSRRIPQPRGDLNLEEDEAAGVADSKRLQFDLLLLAHRLTDTAAGLSDGKLEENAAVESRWSPVSTSRCAHCSQSAVDLTLFRFI